jgi:FixJ family two-component response regulator
MPNPCDAGWVAIVDHHPSMRDARLDLLCEAGFVVRAFPSAEEVIDFGRVHDCSCPTADIRMPACRQLQTRLNSDRLRVPIFITVIARGDQRVRMRAPRAGAER